MSRTFDDSLTADLEGTFFNANEFAPTVTLERGKRRTIGVSAIVATRSYEVGGSDGIVNSIAIVDFDFIATSYAIGGIQQDPQKGDRITTQDGAVFEIRPVNDSGPWFEPVGNGNKLIRVHTQRVRR